MTPLRSLLPFGRDPTPPAGLMDLGALHREIDRLFDDMLRGWPAGSALTSAMAPGAGIGTHLPRIDLRDAGETVEVRADLPGMEEKDIDLRLTDPRTLIIQARRSAEADTSKDGWHVHERSVGTFLRTVPMPCEIDAEKVTATYDKGVLTITLTKAPDAQATARRIEVTKAS